MISFTFESIEYRMFDHLYAVSRCGKVLRQFKPYTPTKRNDGYLSLGRQRLMHRIVATCWVENPTNATWVHHCDENKANNHADNLVWTTPHLMPDEDQCRVCKSKSCTYICPAHVYDWDEENSRLIIGHENCLECGA